MVMHDANCLQKYNKAGGISKKNARRKKNEISLRRAFFFSGGNGDLKSFSKRFSYNPYIIARYRMMCGVKLVHHLE